MALQFDVKNFVVATLGIVKHDDQTPVDATFANETFTSDNEAVVTATVDAGDTPDTGVLDITGVSAGTANITVSADATYTDPNTGLSVTKNKSVVIPVTITQPVSEADTDLVVNFGTPQPVPAV